MLKARAEIAESGRGCAGGGTHGRRASRRCHGEVRPLWRGPRGWSPCGKTPPRIPPFTSTCTRLRGTPSAHRALARWCAGVGAGSLPGAASALHGQALVSCRQDRLSLGVSAHPGPAQPHPLARPRPHLALGALAEHAAGRAVAVHGDAPGRSLSRNHSEGALCSSHAISG